MSFIQVTAFGNMCRDPEVKTTPSGVTVANFSIAANRKVKGEDKTTFLDCKAFEKNAENIGKFFAKGDRIILVGELEQERWDDKTTGEKRSRMTLLVNRFDFPEKATARDDAGGDHGEAAARANFRNEAPAPRSDRDQREQRSAQKQAQARQTTIPETRPLESYGDEDVPF